MVIAAGKGLPPDQMHSGLTDASDDANQEIKEFLASSPQAPLPLSHPFPLVLLFRIPLSAIPLPSLAIPSTGPSHPSLIPLLRPLLFLLPSFPSLPFFLGFYTIMTSISSMYLYVYL